MLRHGLVTPYRAIYQQQAITCPNSDKSLEPWGIHPNKLFKFFLKNSSHKIQLGNLFLKWGAFAPDLNELTSFGNKVCQRLNVNCTVTSHFFIVKYRDKKNNSVLEESIRSSIGLFSYRKQALARAAILTIDLQCYPLRRVNATFLTIEILCELVKHKAKHLCNCPQKISIDFMDLLIHRVRARHIQYFSLAWLSELCISSNCS